MISNACLLLPCCHAYAGAMHVHYNIFIDYLTPSKTLYISPYVVHCLFNTLHSRQAVPADSLIYIILLISKMHDVPKRL